jgi:hypothetical protein
MHWVCFLCWVQVSNQYAELRQDFVGPGVSEALDLVQT